MNAEQSFIAQLIQSISQRSAQYAQPFNLQYQDTLYIWTQQSGTTLYMNETYLPGFKTGFMYKIIAPNFNTQVIATSVTGRLAELEVEEYAIITTEVEPYQPGIIQVNLRPTGPQNTLVLTTAVSGLTGDNIWAGYITYFPVGTYFSVVSGGVGIPTNLVIQNWRES
jgi:hypothetical protein